MVKTILSEFLKRHPDAQLDKNGLPANLCPDDLGYSRALCDEVSSFPCRECWEQKVEE